MKATCFPISHTPEVPVTNASKCIKHRIAGKCMTIICLLIFTMVLSGNGLAHAQEEQIIHGLSSISAPPLPLTGEAIETEEQAVAHAKAILASPFCRWTFLRRNGRQSCARTFSTWTERSMNHTF